MGILKKTPWMQNGSKASLDAKRTFAAVDYLSITPQSDVVRMIFGTGIVLSVGVTA